jgi:hypothetical protein
MSWLSFFAGPEDLSLFVEQILTGSTRCFYEVYSDPGVPVRTFGSAAALAPLKLGHDPQGTGVDGHLALWVAQLMPPPTVRRIQLRGRHSSPQSWRETAEGCGLFWLQSGGLYEDAITASSLGWFTRKAALRHCRVTPGADAVDWNRHGVFARSLQRLLKRELAVARARAYPVLADALRRHRAGTRLLTVRGTREELRVEAA